jgi:hypothetical protein
VIVAGVKMSWRLKVRYHHSRSIFKFAIHILSVLWTRVEAGLIHPGCWGKRKLGAAFGEDLTTVPLDSSARTGTEDRDDPEVDDPEVAKEGDDDEEPENGEEDISNFEGLAEKLIAAAEADDMDDSDMDEEATTSMVTDILRHSGSSSAPSGITIRIPARKTLIPLKDLFIYPEDPAAPSDLDFYWKSGIAKLDETIAAYELLSELHTDTDDWPVAWNSYNFLI